MLAKDLGYTVQELMQKISYAEWVHWIEYYVIESEQRNPSGPRIVRPRNRQEAARALDKYAVPALKVKALACRAT